MLLLCPHTFVWPKSGVLQHLPVIANDDADEANHALPVPTPKLHSDIQTWYTIATTQGAMETNCTLPLSPASGDGSPTMAAASVTNPGKRKASGCHDTTPTLSKTFEYELYSHKVSISLTDPPNCYGLEFSWRAAKPYLDEVHKSGRQMEHALLMVFRFLALSQQIDNQLVLMGCISFFHDLDFARNLSYYAYPLTNPDASDTERRHPEWWPSLLEYFRLIARDTCGCRTKLDWYNRLVPLLPDSFYFENYKSAEFEAFIEHPQTLNCLSKSVHENAKFWHLHNNQGYVNKPLLEANRRIEQLRKRISELEALPNTGQSIS